MHGTRPRRWRVALLAPILLALAGCASMSQEEWTIYRNLRSQGAEIQRVKSPTGAALLNILPGMGDFYVGDIGAAGVSILCWPSSIIWAVPNGAAGARLRNRRATIAHYVTGEGKGQFDPGLFRDPPVYKAD